MKLWGGRFESGPSEVFERFSGSLDFDRRLIDADIRGSQAFARALERVGILSAEERSAIVAAFDAIAAESASAAFFEGAADEDVHTLVIRKLKEKAGAVADKIHTGRSRNEQVSLDTRLWLREESDRARGLVAGVMEALVSLAEAYPDAVIPGYTHMRRAQAVLWPHYLLAYFEMFARDWERLGEARARAPTCCRWARARWPARVSRSTARLSPRTWASTASPATAWMFPATAISPSTSCMPPASP
jgi:argininosuccinate lyase